MQTKEEFFQFEKSRQKIFDNFYKKHNWDFERIEGRENKDYDVLVNIKGWRIKIEEKSRDKDYGDFLVEIEQDTETKSLGWLFYTKADCIFYEIKGKIYVVFIDKLREYVNRNKDKLPVRISEKGWGRTKNVIISWSEILKNSIGQKLTGSNLKSNEKKIHNRRGGHNYQALSGRPNSVLDSPPSEERPCHDSLLG